MWARPVPARPERATFIQRQVATWSEHYDPRDFVLTSFTRAAAAVLTGRVDIPHSNVATLHALGYRALGSPPIAEKAPLAAQWNDQCPAAWRVNEDTADVEDDDAVVIDQVAATEFGDYCLARNRMLPEGHPLVERTREFGKAWEDYKAQTGSIDFADMIAIAQREIDECPGEPRVLVVDEAQDLTPIQWALVNRWASAPSIEQVIIAGDPAQCIYEWAGALPGPLLEPLPTGHQRMLGQSYRLPPAIHDHAETWLARHSPPMMEGREYAAKPGERGQVRTLPGVPWQGPESLLRDLEGQLAAGRTCMVLATCSYMLRPLVAALRAQGLPFHNPYRRRSAAWNPLGAAREGAISTIERVLAYLKPDRETWGNASRWWTPAEATAWVDMLAASVFNARGIKTQLLKDLGSTREVIVDMVLGALAADGPQQVIEHDTGWLAEHVIERFRAPVAYADAIRQARGGQALRQEPQIIVGSVHSVKGGEADVVYVFPDQSYKGWQASMTGEGRDAVIRLAYVAFTRAKQELVLLGTQTPQQAMWG